jgi:TRAP-type C4-dicarboxylate transport system permease small subunit
MTEPGALPTGHGHPSPEDTMTDLVSDGPVVAHGPLARVAYALGALGLLGATLADSIAVAGRHTGLHLLGSIELVQTMVVLLASSAMLIVTIVGGHASVHMVTERLRAPTAARLARIAALLSAFVFLLFAAGSAWISVELWNGHEQTELLRIPLRWLRLLWTLFALLIAARFLRFAMGKPA